MDYESWARGEIAQLRARAAKAAAEADGMETMLRKWIEAQRGAQPRTPASAGNGAAKSRGGRKKGAHGSKTGFVMGMVADSGTAGVTTDEIWKAAEAAAIGIKRSSLRSMLWHAKADGLIASSENGRYYSLQKRPDA